VLRRAEQQFINLLDRLFERTRVQLHGKSRSEIEATLERLPRESAALTSAFLLDRGGRALYPVLDQQGAWATLTPRAVVESLAPELRSTPRVIAAYQALEEAGSEASMQLARDALMTLEEVDAQLLPSKLGAYVTLRRGLLQFQMQAYDVALVEFDTALAYLEDVRDSEFAGPLRISLQLAEAETELAFAEANPGDEFAKGAQDRAQTALTNALRALAAGQYDYADEALLDGIWQKARTLAARIAASKPAFGDELRGLDVRNLERKARRHTLRQLFDSTPLRERIRQTRDPARFPLTMPFAGGLERKETSLIAVVMVEDKDGETLLPGLKLDLEILLAEPMLELEAMLARQGRYEVALLDENNERLGEFVSRAPADDAQVRELKQRLTTPLRLGPPLLGYSLAATPRDPESVLAEEERAQIWRGMLLLALALVAGAGAFIFIRSLRREAELARLKTDFVGRVSHELKTPLALIRMYGETLALGRASEQEQVQRFAGIIARESDRLTAMIENILDFSRIEAGRKQYEKNPVELDAVLLDILDSYRPQLEAAGFDVHDEIEPELFANCDAGALNQALVNLLGNARKYCQPEGPKEITLVLRRAGDFAEIEVRDRGIGVPEGERERVFDTFYRASTAGERRGAGLGLALIRHFVEAHGGRVSCSAREGGGSVFQLRLPLLTSPASQGGFPEETSPELTGER
jgi:signal transduction histidine kinase